MNPTPKSIAITGAAGLGAIACFLNFLPGGTLSEMGKAAQQNIWTKHMAPSIWMFLGPFLFLALIGGLALMLFLDGAWLHGKLKLTGFITMLKEGAIGGRVIVLCTVTALVACIMGIANPDPKRARAS